MSDYRVPYAVRKTSCLSSKEALLADFCKKNNIPFQKNTEKHGRGTSHYSFDFTPEFLDDIERKVVAYCDKNNINYKFVKGNDGIHHYQFAQAIGSDLETCDKDYVGSYADEALDLIRSKSPAPDFDKIRENESLLAKQRKKFESEPFEEVDHELNSLKTKLENHQKESKKLWNKAFAYVNFKYSKKLSEEEQELKNRINQLEYEKKELQNMAFLALAEIK